MIPHPDLEKLLNWLLNHSLQAGALVLLVLAVQWIFRRQLTNRWRFALWWIVLVRLLLPFSPESAVSLFNYFQPQVNVAGPYYSASTPSAPVADAEAGKNYSHLQTPSPAYRSGDETVSPASGLKLAPANQMTPAIPVSAANHSIQSQATSVDAWLIPGAVVLWLAGIFGLAVGATVQTVRFRRRLARSSQPAKTPLIQLLHDVQREAGVSRRIELLETGAVNSPALFGLWRLRLLLPRGLDEKFTPRELRYIFLHELAHVKRGDLWLNWLVTGLQILHWFNPLVWFGFARLRADRELACDELALLCAGDQAGTSYGETVIKLLENLSRPAAVPGLMGILEDKHQMRRRISMIARFRQPGRWSVLAVFLIAALAAAALTDAQTQTSGGGQGDEAKTSSLVNSNSQSLLTSAATRPDLTGQVLAKGGKPLPVIATVFIATAGPKVGTSTFCPSCYADCQKHATTDAQGNFEIKSLDPQLQFQVLAVAKGFRPKYVNKVEPAKGTPVKIELEPIASTDATPDRSLRGRVVDVKGQPVEGAVVEMVGIETKDGGGSYGSLPGIDPLAVTDEQGEFLITAKKPFDMMDVKVTARTFADKAFHQLPSGKLNQLVMTEGAIITGRVLRDGHPLAGVSVGISGVERQSGIYVGHFEIGTDAEGKFAFVNVPPDVDFWIYTGMNSMKQVGAVPIQKIRSGKDGETTDVGEMVAVPAHRLAGRVVLADGQPLPPKVRLLVSREDAWDSMQITLGKDGSFDTTGIPNELIDLSARVKGYHVSARNLSVDQLNPFRLTGRVDRDITNLVFLLEKGPDPQPGYGQVDPEYNDIRQRILRGAEGVQDHSREWSVSGRVLDADTQEPVQNFRVTPGEIVNFNQTGWSTLRAVDGSNGVYQVYLSKRTVQPLLKVEADGYLPAGDSLQPQDATNVDFILKKGSGPAGTVVTTDGKPAAGATLVLLTGEINGAGFNSDGELSAYGNRSAMQVTDTNGKFAFKPVYGAKWLAASSSNGFIVVTLESLATNATVTLQPYGTITGSLNRPSGPGTNETLDINFTGDNGPHINLWRPTDTDARGHFEFKNVPPAQLQISSRMKIQNGNGWTENPLQAVDLKPGQKLVVSIHAGDRPSPEQNSFQPPPMPKLIPGVRVKGIVIGSNGKPANDAEVALQLSEGPFYIALGRGRLSASGLQESGLLVNAGADGSFNLPLYEKAQSVIAISEDGFARVSLEQLKASHQITLQKWGSIEGTLRVGHHLGTNETVVLDQRPQWSNMTIRKPDSTNNVASITNADAAPLQPLMFDFNAFQARTDDQGRFVFTYVPPGEQTIARLVPEGNGSWTHSQLATVEVKPGKTTVADVGGQGRTIIGKLTFNADTPLNSERAFAVIKTPMPEFLEKTRQLKTDEERRAFYSSADVQRAMKNFRYYSAAVQPDGSFKSEDVLPGNYEINFQQHFFPDAHATSVTMFTSAQEIIVPAAKDTNDNSVVDLGTIELKKLVLPIPKVDSEKK